MKEAVEVTAKFKPQGRINPLRFIWRERHYRVESTGRRWTDEEGVHILVMVPRNRVFHLLFEPGENRWYLVHRGATPHSSAA